MTSERAALWLSAGTALAVGGIGVGFALWTGSRAILLDGLFNLTYFATALLTLKVATLVGRPDTAEYPFGYIFLEPLMNGVKGVLILGISMLALVDAVAALLSGGRTIAAGPAIGYGAIATVACTAAAVLLKRAHRRTGSPLVGTDADSWTVNAAISAAVLLAFAGIPAIDALGRPDLVPYVDPALVALVVLISLAVPVRMAWLALTALLNRSPPPAVRDALAGTVRDALSGLPVEAVYVRAIRPGRSFYIAVHVVLPATFAIDGLGSLDAVRAQVQGAVRRRHGAALVDVLFTADPRWAAPGAASADPEA